MKDRPFYISLEATVSSPPRGRPGGAALNNPPCGTATATPAVAVESYLRTDLKERFLHLLYEWKRDTRFVSSSTDMVKHPAYQAIIALGKPVIPLILDELRRSPDHWFPALRALTGENPVPAEDRGKVQKMAAAWLRWGEQNYR